MSLDGILLNLVRVFGLRKVPILLTSSVTVAVFHKAVPAV